MRVMGRFSGKLVGAVAEDVLDDGLRGAIGVPGTD